MHAARVDEHEVGQTVAVYIPGQDVAGRRGTQQRNRSTKDAGPVVEQDRIRGYVSVDGRHPSKYEVGTSTAAEIADRDRNGIADRQALARDKSVINAVIKPDLAVAADVGEHDIHFAVEIEVRDRDRVAVRGAQ